MLIDSVNRLDANKSIKLYNIDTYARPARISSVPALLLLPGREILYGRQVFDHLLLPGRGLLVMGGGSGGGSGGAAAGGGGAAGGAVGGASAGEPMGFASSKAQTSASFASIASLDGKDEANPLGFQPDSWAWMGSGGGADGVANVPVPAVGPAAPGASGATPGGLFSVETRDLSGKALPEMADIMSRREQDLRILS